MYLQCSKAVKKAGTEPASQLSKHRLTIKDTFLPAQPAQVLYLLAERSS